MAVLTYAQQLAEVQVAIQKIESGAQSYTTASGRQLTRGSLKDLYAREQWLRGMAAREATGSAGIRVRGVTPA